MPVRRQTIGAPELKPEVVAVVLAGWTARPPDAVDADPHGCAELFALFGEREAGIVQQWHAHEAYLRAVAEEWGWEPETECRDGVQRFWGEALAWKGVS